MKRFLSGFLCCALLMTTTLAFAESAQTIGAVFGRVKLVVDGKPIAQETLLYNDTTYVPLRAAAEALGKEVSYDGDTQTAYIGTAVLPATTASENKQEGKKEVDYKDFAGVLDFGALTGTALSGERYMDSAVGGKRYIYDYPVTGRDDAKIKAYFEAMKIRGFQVEYDDEDETYVDLIGTQFDVLMTINSEYDYVAVWVVESITGQAKGIGEAASAEPAEPKTSGKGDRENPYKLNETAACTDTYGKIQVTLLETIKGSAAEQIVLEANRFNDPPSSDQEYCLVKIRIKAIEQNEASQPIYVSGRDFDFYTSSGAKYASVSVAGLKPTSTELFNGGEGDIWVYQLISKGDNANIVFDDSDIGSVWFKLN